MIEQRTCRRNLAPPLTTIHGSQECNRSGSDRTPEVGCGQEERQINPYFDASPNGHGDPVRQSNHHSPFGQYQRVLRSGPPIEDQSACQNPKGRQ